jgi:hypothetical protein
MLTYHEQHPTNPNAHQGAVVANSVGARLFVISGLFQCFVSVLFIFRKGQTTNESHCADNK